MKVKVSSPLLSFNGEIMKDEQGNPLEVREFLIASLAYEDRDAVPSHTQKVKNYELCRKIALNDVVDFAPEDIVFIREQGSKVLSVLAYGQISALFDETKDENKV